MLNFRNYRIRSYPPIPENWYQIKVYCKFIRDLHAFLLKRFKEVKVISKTNFNFVKVLKSIYN